MSEKRGVLCEPIVKYNVAAIYDEYDADNIDFALGYLRGVFPFSSRSCRAARPSLESRKRRGALVKRGREQV